MLLLNLYQWLYFVINISSSSSWQFCPRAGPALQAQEHRLQLWQRQVFHRKPGDQGCSCKRDWIGMVAFRCFQHSSLSLFSVWTGLKISEKIPEAPSWRQGEWIWLTGPSRFHRNSPQGFNYQFHQGFLTRSDIQKSQSPFAPCYSYTVKCGLW